MYISVPVFAYMPHTNVLIIKIICLIGSGGRIIKINKHRTPELSVMGFEELGKRL